MEKGTVEQIFSVDQFPNNKCDQIKPERHNNNCLNFALGLLLYNLFLNVDIVRPTGGEFSPMTT
jgi:hypothetical protein